MLSVHFLMFDIIVMFVRQFRFKEESNDNIFQ